MVQDNEFPVYHGKYLFPAATSSTSKPEGGRVKISFINIDLNKNEYVKKK